MVVRLSAQLAHHVPGVFRLRTTSATKVANRAGSSGYGWWPEHSNRVRYLLGEDSAVNYCWVRTALPGASSAASTRTATNGFVPPASPSVFRAESPAAPDGAPSVRPPGERTKGSHSRPGIRSCTRPPMTKSPIDRYGAAARSRPHFASCLRTGSRWRCDNRRRERLRFMLRA